MRLVLKLRIQNIANKDIIHLELSDFVKGEKWRKFELFDKAIISYCNKNNYEEDY